MAINSINSNTTALRAITQLGKTQDSLSKVYSQLSSGLRITSASDDPAGLSVADSLKNFGKLSDVAIRNANDGISLTNIADSALESVSSVLSRLAELAQQSANGVYSDTQRSAISTEFIALGSEVERIASTTEFNGLKLLSNSSNITLQVGYAAASTSQISISSVISTLSSLGLGSTSGALTFSVISSSTALSQSASLNALTAVNSAISTLSAIRGTVGAAQSRLEVAVNNLSVAKENFALAESRIRDVDVAFAAAELTRLSVLQQAGISVLAQANQQPARVLELLK